MKRRGDLSISGVAIFRLMGLKGGPQQMGVDTLRLRGPTYNTEDKRKGEGGLASGA